MYIVKIPCKNCHTLRAITTVPHVGLMSTTISVLKGCHSCGFKPKSKTDQHSECVKAKWLTLKDGYKEIYIHPQVGTYGYHVIEEKNDKEKVK